ncbi:MAG: hypothetical protein ACI9G1_002096, partial [Pirellulaceae bacterium]
MRIANQYRIAIIALSWALAFPLAVHAQEKTPVRLLEPSDTSSPAATLNSLIDSCNEL